MGYPLFYEAWDTNANALKPGDGGNHTVTVDTVAPDGTTDQVTGLSVTELGNGAYRVAPTDEQLPPGYSFKVHGASSTPNVYLFGDSGQRPPGDVGTGARTATITVDDGSDPVVGATVRLTRGAISHVYTTDGDGEITANVDDGSWTIAITAPGFSYAGTTLVVDGDEAATYSMTAVSITLPANAGNCTCQIKTVDKAQADDPLKPVYFRMTSPPPGAGYAHPRNRIKVISDENAIAEIELPIGATFNYWRGTDDSDAASIEIPNQATLVLAAIAGTDET